MMTSIHRTSSNSQAKEEIGWTNNTFSKGRVTVPKRMNFRKSSKRPLTPPIIFRKSYCNFFLKFEVSQTIHDWYCDIWLRLWNFAEIVKFGQNCDIWSKLWNLVKIAKSGQNFEIWSKLWNLVKIVISGQNCEIWSNFWSLRYVRWLSSFGGSGK